MLSRTGQVLACIIMFSNISAQDSMKTISGTWEGVFWEEYETRIHFNSADPDFPSGSIEMFDSQSQIQDDPLSKIKLDGRHLTFYIPAKETEFEGILDETFSELAGKFIFPDGSEHPFSAKKSPDG